MDPLAVAGIAFVVLMGITILYYLLFIMNRPYETAPQQMPLYAKAGETVTCTKGHEICDLRRDIHVGDPIQTGQFTNWRNQNPPEPHSEIMPCPTCGEPYIKGPLAMQLHIENEWRTTHHS
jgi:hypothetical protein